MKYVKHLKFPEWGIGQVILELEEKADVEFRRGVVRFPLSDLEEVQKPLQSSNFKRSGKRVQKETMLDIFKEGNGISPTRAELMQMGFGNPNAVIMGLRKDGRLIEMIPEEQGSCRYRLVEVIS